MTPAIFAPLAFARYEFRLQAQARVDLPPFLGSTLRGALGAALKDTLCLMSRRRCEKCAQPAECSYAYLFETPVPPELTLLRNQPHAPHPFILQLSAPSTAARQTFDPFHVLTFGLLLLGQAITLLPHIIRAVRLMARRGLGAERTCFELIAVERTDLDGNHANIYDAKANTLHASSVTGTSLAAYITRRMDERPASSDGGALRLGFITPTRLRVRGDLQSGINGELLVRSLLRRVVLLVELHGGTALDLPYRDLIDRAATIETCLSTLRWHDVITHWDEASRK